MHTYTFHITLFGLAFVPVIFVGFTFVALLWWAKKADGAANRFVAAALAVAVLWICRILITDIGLAGYAPVLNRLPLQFSLALGPLLFFFVLKITRPDHKVRLVDLLHFCPLLVELGLWGWRMLANGSKGVFVLQVVQLPAFISVSFYLYLSLRSIERFYRQQKFTGGDRYRHGLRWLRNLVVSFGLLWLLWIPFTAADLFIYNGRQGPQAYYPVYLVLIGMMIWIAARAFLRPEIGIPADAAAVLKPELPAGLRQKGTLLKKAVREKRYYQDPGLSLVSLAAKLQLTTHELSRIINTVLKKSFNDFINEFRVAEVIRKMQDPAFDHITMLGIAYESGFNSQSTFTRIFKQMTGKSPVEYKNELSKDRPSYNLGSVPRPAKLILSHETTPKWHREKSVRNFMFKNHFKTAWRNLMRNKSYAAINVTGLAIGMATCLLIFLIVQYETSFDAFHTNAGHIYRVVTVSKGPDGVTLGSGTQIPLADGLRLDFPQLSNVGSIIMNDGSHYSVNDKSGAAARKFKEDSAYYADPQFFRIFSFKWLAGDKKTALAEPNAVVLSRAEADKFFGDWHTAMGKTIRYENRRDLRVTGILENTPVNTDLPIRLVVSWVTLVNKGGDLSGNSKDWVSTFSDRNTYVVLPPNLGEKQLNVQLASFAQRHIPAPYNKNTSLQLQALRDMHFNTKVSVYGGHPFSKELINVISLIGLFLLIIACVNFINLATAQAVNRSKEVGIRKVMGSNRFQLILQFISETLLITLFAVVIATVVSLFTLPMVNNLLQIHLSGGLLINSTVVMFLVCVIILVTFLAGFYPALVLSGFNPVEALKNKIKAGRASGISLRRVLVVTQFCIAQFLVIGTLVLIYQMNYFKNKPLGFNKDAVITVPFPGDSISRTRINGLKDELLQQAGVKDISLSLYGPADNSSWMSDFEFNNATKPVSFGASLKWADPEYFKLYDIKFVAGGPYRLSDTIAGYVVNETLIHKLGITNPDQAIGKYITIWNDKKKKAQITGVVKDFNAGSLRSAIPPVLMASWKDTYSKLNIKVRSANISQTLANIERQWNKTYPEGIYEYQFLDKTIADFYKSEDELSTLYKIFAGIAIFISCLGLYGLVSFMAVQRIKEVGIRKTLGASAGQIVYLFSKEFTILIMVAFAIAAPVGYYFMHNWLQDFTYRITIGPDIFLLAVVSSIAIAWLTVGYKALRAALMNPVKSLRSE